MSGTTFSRYQRFKFTPKGGTHREQLRIWRNRTKPSQPHPFWVEELGPGNARVVFARWRFGKFKVQGTNDWDAGWHMVPVLRLSVEQLAQVTILGWPAQAIRRVFKLLQRMGYELLPHWLAEELDDPIHWNGQELVPGIPYHEAPPATSKVELHPAAVARWRRENDTFAYQVEQEQMADEARLRSIREFNQAQEK